MALIVTFTSVEQVPGITLPIEVADQARTERVQVDSGTDGAPESASSGEAREGEKVVSLYAEQACWVVVAKDDGNGVVAVPGTGRFLAAGERMQLSIKRGHKVAVCGIENQ